MQIRQREFDSSLAQFSDAVPDWLQRIYLARGVCADQQIDHSMQALLPPAGLKGMAEAVELLVAQLVAGGRMLVVGDFDADGATSSALAVLALRAMGAQQVDFLVPNRFEYGYGLTPEIVAVALQRAPQLIITVDNGIASVDGVQTAAAQGVPVLVTDHHLPGAELPPAAAIVNPNQPGCPFASKNLAGVGVIFYLMLALRARLRECNWFVERALAEPNMADFLDLVALGTVADVVALDQNNRVLVAQGLARIRAGRCRAGIRALARVAGRDIARLQSADLGFALGPRLNAAGRLDDMSLGIQCLLSDSDTEAMELARALDDLNRDRRAIEADMQREAQQLLAPLLQQDMADLPYGLCIYDSGWHQGVIGILASRIKEQYHRPVIAFADAEESTAAQAAAMIKGSARSIAGVHIRDTLDAVANRNPGLLSKFGGHAMAAGLSLPRENLQRFRTAFDQELRRRLTPEQLQAVLWTDGELPARALSLEQAQLLAAAGPWGQHFPEPLFEGEFWLQQQRVLGGKHLKLVVAPLENSALALDAIAFNVAAACLEQLGCARVYLVYRLAVNYFRGSESLQLMVDHIVPGAD